MSIENEIAGLTQSTTDLLEAVNTKKATLDSAVDTAEAAKVVATSKAAEATTVVANASTYETNAAASATQAAASAASASQIVTGVATGLPNIRPSLNLDFVNSKRVDPRMDFTRSTTATYYDGETTVKAEENLVNHSEEMGNWTSQNSTVSQNSAIAPDGTTTADLVYPSISDWRAIRYQAPLKIGSTYTVSIYAKSSGKSWLTFCNGGSGTTIFASFDVSTGAVGTLNSGSTATITSVGDGWYRCTVTFTATGVHTVLGVSDQDNAQAVTANGNDGLYLWGAQAEERSYVTAYTPTTSYPITNYVPVLKTAGINEPRLDHDPVTGECKGLLIEGDRTNYVRKSSDFTINGVDWYYIGNVTSKNNVTIAPDGTLTAGKIMPTGSNHRFAGHMSLQSSMVTGATYTISGFYKHDGSYWTRIKLGGVFGGEAAVFDFISGEFVGTETNVTRTSATDVGDGWWRLSVTYVFQNHIGNLYPYALVAQCKQANGSTTPLDSAEYNGVYIWGMQYEKADFPSSYIPTDGATVTRADEYAPILFSDFGYNTGGYSIYGEFRTTLDVEATQAFYISADNNVFARPAYSNYGSGGMSTYGSTSDVVGFNGPIPDNSIIKIGLALDNTGFQTSSSFGISQAISSGRNADFRNKVTKFYFGSSYSSNTQIYGYVRNIKYYPTKIADSELQALTQE